MGFVRRPAFTLIELLVVIALIAILAALLFPVFARSRASSRHVSCSQDQKQVGLAFLMYTQDYDNVLPLAHAHTPEAGWLWSHLSAVPDAWRPATPFHRAAYQVEWANSIYPYMKNYGMYACPDTQDYPWPAVTYPAADRPASVTYTYNGLLQSLPLAKVHVDAAVPLLWEGLGNVRLKGFALSQPVLECDRPDTPCIYQPKSGGRCAPGNGGASRMLVKTLGSMWVHSHGANFCFVDGHVKWRGLGAAPDHTDAYTDPFSRYDDHGVGLQYWTDGCHPWLFRPDAP